MCQTRIFALREHAWLRCQLRVSGINSLDASREVLSKPFRFFHHVYLKIKPCYTLGNQAFVWSIIERTFISDSRNIGPSIHWISALSYNFRVFIFRICIPNCGIVKCMFNLFIKINTCKRTKYFCKVEGYFYI